jgi:PAS domain S-box-containing protein
MDISKRKQAERELIAGEALFRTMADSSTALIFFVKPDSRLRYLNKTARETFGVPPQAWENFDWSSYLHPDDVAKTYSLLEEAFQSKTGYVNEFRIRRYDGVYRVVYSTGSPVIDDNGELIGYVGTGFDITELRETQQKLTSYAHKLEESNKELEHFAAIASHDLQEPLRKVLLFTDHLQKVDGASLSETGADDLKRIQGATGRMQRLINDLLDLSRITRRGSPFEKVDLHFLTREVITELSYFYPNAESRVTVEGGMIIHADYSQMHQMLAQLLDNALKFHKPDQLSSVTVRIQSSNKDKCQITISDDGLGIKPNQLSQIFDAFVRLHHGAEFPGTGIGLALVKKIVERHNGGITVESTPGQGSTFTVTLPISSK